MMQNKDKKYIKKFMILLFWLGVWQITAVCVDNFLLVVTPLQALRALTVLAGQVEFWRSALGSLWRIAAGFLLGAFLGLLLAAVSYRYRLAEEILRPFMVFCKAVPVAVFAVLLLIWWGASPLAVAVCFFVVFPNIYLNTLEGLKSADAELIEMAEVFRLPFATRFFYIYRPALKPFLLNAFHLSLGMSWKSGVAAEVIGTPLHSIGGALYLAKIYLDTADLFAWTAVIIVLSVLFEKIVFGCVEYFFRWEPACKRPAMPQKNVSRERRTLCVADFGKCYHDRWIFRHVEQEFHGGEPYFLDTPSGSGKTTFFRCLCGLERPEEGEVSGIDAFSVQFQEDRLCEEYSAVKNLEMVMGDAREARKALTWLLPEEALGQPCHELSGGMKRRVSLVRAMEAGAQCVLLDEPFTGLDEENREKAYEYIRTHANGRIIMIATHIRPWENMPEDVQKGEGLWERIRETQE